MTLPASSQEHKHKAKDVGIVKVAVVTVSDTRDQGNDANGQYLKAECPRHNCELTYYTIVKDEPNQVEAAFEAAVENAQIVIFNGGTGIAKRDRTFDVLSCKLVKVLPGFGEIFRSLSYEEIGAAAVLSRAVAGVYKDAVVFSLPGSNHAVRLAWGKLIAPEIAHYAWELVR